jgi:hypothetical protein
MQNLAIWIGKIEKSKKDSYIKTQLYQDMTRYVEEAFLYDNNMIIEDFPFYQMLSPRLQTKFIDSLFDTDTFRQNYQHIFVEKWERNYINSLIMNLYSKILPDRETIVAPGQRFDEICFLNDGIVSVHNQEESDEHNNNSAFFILPSKSIFGDFSVLFQLPSPFLFKTNYTRYKQHVDDTHLMSASKKKKEAKKAYDERTMRFKNGKRTRATVLMCIATSTVKEINETYEKSANDFRVRALNRLSKYVDCCDIS